MRRSCGDSRIHEIHVKREGRHFSGFLPSHLAVAQGFLQIAVQMLLPTMNGPAVPVLFKKYLHIADSPHMEAITEGARYSNLAENHKGDADCHEQHAHPSPEIHMFMEKERST